jgi:erythromycin esterase-like protein
MRPETLAVHAGHRIDLATGAVAPPLWLSTTFERAADGSFPHGFEYIRDDNPNRRQLEECLAALEGGLGAAAFASGSAATMSLLQTLAPGDHVLAPQDAYFGTAHILSDLLQPWGLAVTFVDMTDLEQVRAALRPTTRLIWTETPSNPLLAITDLVAIMSQSLFGSWQTQEYEAFFAWLRAYNANPANTTKVHFYGMDIQAVSQSDFDAVQQYIQQVAPQQVSVVQSLYAPIIASSLPYPYRTYVALNAATKQQYQTQAQRVYDLLQAHQQDYTQRSSPQQFSLALRDARIIVQFTIYHNSSTQKEALQRYYQRDGFMAENIEWIHDHAAGSNPKLIIWAHDGHIANDTTYRSQDGRNMGGELRAQYKDSYLPIGTTLYQGTCRVYDYPAGVLQAIPPAPANTYNYTLGQAGLPLFMLDLRNVPSGPVATWANGAGSITTLLLYGLGGEDLSTPGPLNQWFDVLVHVQNTTPSQHL